MPQEASSPGQSKASWLILALSPALMASNMIAARWIGGSIPPVATAFWRWLLTFLILLPFVGPALWQARAKIATHWRGILLLGGLGMGLCGAPVYQGAITTTATNIGLIYATAPVLVLLLERFVWQTPVTGRQILGIILCLTGMAGLIAKGDIGMLLHLSFTPGDLWIVLATLSWALYSVLLKRQPDQLPLVPRLAAMAAGGVIVTLPFLVAETWVVGPPTLDQRTVVTLLFLALVPAIAAYLTYAWLIGRFGPERASLLMYLAPVYNAGIAWALLGELPQLFHLFGLAMILPGLYLASVPRGAGLLRFRRLFR